MAVRRERVILDLQDNLSSGMVRAAGATALLRRELNDLDGMSVRITQTFNDNTRGVDQFSRTLDQSGRSIDRYSGRLAALAQAGLVFGPSLIPISAVAVPAVTGLASQLGFAAIGMGSLVVATRGVGDALKAVNAAALEPTAANLEKARHAMADLAPETQTFVERLHDLQPVLADIRDAAAAGWFPGLTEALDHFDRLGPRIANLFEAIGEQGGRLVAEGAAALTGPQWFQFLDFVETEGPDALDKLGRSIGNVVHGMSELWMAFDPLNDDFSNWLLQASRDFDGWAEGLSKTEGFQAFIDYIRESGPQVERTLGAIAEATVAIVKAASPLGGPVLAAFEVVADTLKTIADSPFGTKIFTMAAAFVVLNKTLAVTAGLLARTGFISAATAGRVTGAGTGAGPGPVGGGPTGGPMPVPIMGRVNAARTGFAQFRTDLRDLRNATIAQRNASTSLIAAQARVNATMRATGASAAKAGAGVAAFAVATGAVGEGLGLQNTAMLALVGSVRGPFGAAIGAGIGLIVDITAANRKWEDSLRQINAAIESGEPAQIAEGNRLLEERLKHLRDMNDVTGFWDTFGDIGGFVKNGLKLPSQEDFDEIQFGGVLQRSTALQQISAGFGNIAAQADLAAKEVEDLRQELINFGTVATKHGQWRAYQEAIDNFTKAVKENGRTLDETTPKGRAVAEALESIATTAVAFSQNLSGAERREYLKKARDTFVDAAEKAGGLDKQAKELLRTLNDLIGDYPVKISAETRQARREIERIKELVAGLPTRRKVDVFVNYLRGATLQSQGGRDGDPSTPYASGGFTGRGGRLERAGVVHRGEVVLPQEIVARDRGMLLDRYGHLPGMDQLAKDASVRSAQEVAAHSRAALASSAERSAASRGGSASGLSRADLDYLADRLAAQRPLVGVQHVTPHNYNEFRREQDDARRRASLGGAPR